MASRGVPSGGSLPGSMPGAGYTGVNRTSPVPALGMSEYQGKPRPDCPEMFQPQLEIHGLCAVGMSAASWGSGNREGLVAWRQPHLLPAVFPGPPTPTSAPAPCASEGISEPAHPPCLPLPGARFGRKYPGPPTHSSGQAPGDPPSNSLPAASFGDTLVRAQPVFSAQQLYYL